MQVVLYSLLYICRLKAHSKFLYFCTINISSIGLDKSGYQVNIFLISPRKGMLWVLTTYVLVEK